MVMSTDAQASLFGGKTWERFRTVDRRLRRRHAVAATKVRRDVPDEADIIVLVDYAERLVKTSLDVARALEGRLVGRASRHAGQLVDKSVLPHMGTFPPDGGERHSSSGTCATRSTARGLAT